MSPRLLHLLVYLFFCLAGLGSGTTQGAELRLSGKEEKLALMPVLTVFEDKSTAMAIGQVAELNRFTPQPELSQLGVNQSAAWLKFELTNTTHFPLTRWLELPGWLRDVRMFLRQDGQWVAMDAGTAHPFDERPIVAVSLIFPIPLAAQETRSVYVRISGPTHSIIEPTLWDPVAYRTQESRTRLIDGLLLGAFALMAVIAFVLFWGFRHLALLFAGLATTTYFLGELSAKGYSFMYLWPNATEWVIRGMPVYALIGVGLNLLFLRELLGTRKNFPRIDRLLLILVATEWLPAPGILWGDLRFWASASFPQHFPVTVIMVVVGIYAMTQGMRAARYYVAGYALLALGSLFHLMGVFGLNIRADLADYGLPIGMLLNNLLLMLAAVERILEIRRRKEEAKNALLRAHAAHEAELENAVEERTADLNAALIETRKASEAQTRLLAYISHDLRAPLANIVNYVNLLSHHSDPEVRRHQAAIERSALHQLELIDDLVEYARGKLEQLELTPTATYLHDWLDDIAKQAELLAAQQNNRFVLEVDELPPVAVFDPKRLRQVLVNLLVNAAKFTNNGVIRLAVKTVQQHAGEVELRFAVEDTGTGISRYDIERIFEPFERRSKQREGFGLGLSIGRQLVQAMGGELKASSVPDVGSCFSFTLILPLATEADVTQPVQAFVFPEPFGAGKTLLIADDNPASRDYLREVLSTADFDIVCAEDGAQALRLALDRSFDAILVDQVMPHMSGWDFLQALHQAKPEAKMPIVLCSAMRAKKPEGFPPDLDFAATLLKPVSADKVLHMIQDLLAPAATAAPKPILPDDMRAQLKEMIGNGSVSEIEEWASNLALDHPQLTSLADSIYDAAIRLDFDFLNRLAGETNQTEPERGQTTG